MDNDEYLASPDTVSKWTFALTSVDWRKQDLLNRLARSKRLTSGEEVYELRNTGEEGAMQIRALLGLDTMVTNINIPNQGQISNLPLGVIVETNAVLRCDGFKPVMAGAVPDAILPMISRSASENEAILDAAFSLDLDFAYEKFRDLNMIKKLTETEKKALFDEMVSGTGAYLNDYRN